MSHCAIKIENLGKKYQINPADKTGRTSYLNLRETLTEKTKHLFLPKKLLPTTIKKEDFWALKGVDLDIERGTKIAIVGHNGAGKSTLLKILSRVTTPTTGKVTLHGKITSLLEVGAGFHPELTGRENIYLNGSILGMSYTEIRRQFDAIVDFSGAEKFIDTPIKRYSSGMRTRLGFAVTTHLQSDILIVDEALAVGDKAFQEKGLAKMNALCQSQGSTVLFVSHNAEALRSICDKGFLLDKGELICQGDINTVLTAYSKKD